jgi:hypothetical protein
LLVEVPIESRTKVWIDLSIDWTIDVPIDWSIDMTAEWWIELWIEVPSKLPTEMPIDLPSPEYGAGSGSESWRERMGECGACARWKCCGLPGLKQRRNRM